MHGALFYARMHAFKSVHDGLYKFFFHFRRFQSLYILMHDMVYDTRRVYI